MIEVGNVVKSFFDRRRKRGVVLKVRRSLWSGKTLVTVHWDYEAFSCWYEEDLVVLKKYKWKKL